MADSSFGRTLFAETSGRSSPGAGTKTPTRVSTDSRKTSTHTKRSPSRDFVVRALSPRIAVVSTPDADRLCQENGLSDFCQLLKPFGDRIEGRVTARDHQGLPQALEPFFVRFVDLSKLEAPDPDRVLRLLAQAVRNQLQTYDGAKYEIFRSKQDVNEQYLSTPLDDITPWYSRFRRLFVEHTAGVSEHETFDHPVACILAITANNPDPLNTVLRLYNLTSPAPVYEKGFIEPNVVKGYAILHDNVQGNLKDSEYLLDQMKKTFGANCFMFKINSVPPQSPDQTMVSDDPFVDAFNTTVPTSPAVPDIWSSYVDDSDELVNVLTLPSSFADGRRDSNGSSVMPSQPGIPSLVRPGTDVLGLGLPGISAEPAAAQTARTTRGARLNSEDFSSIQAFVREFVVGTVIPWMERQASFWNEEVASSRRGLTGRLFSAGRRYFGAGRQTPGLTGPASITTTSASGGNSPPSSSGVSVYPYSSPEFQMRKLADFAFMLGDYKFALSTYETARKDFAADRAYKHVAGALEMSALCHFMLDSQVLSSGKLVDVDNNMEQAVSNHYIGRCQARVAAMRATLLYYEMLKSRQFWRESTTALIRMTGDNTDLASALLLEQAAHAFLRSLPAPMVRKYAFHMVMAGHRYSKCGQREHAFRCYKAASLSYEDKFWSLIDDHVHFALGRQAFHLSDIETSIRHFLRLLRESSQSEEQQASFVREFLYIYKQNAVHVDKIASSIVFQELPIPLVDDAGVRLSLPNTATNFELDDLWRRMERELIEEPSRGGANDTRRMALEKSSGRTVCAVGEPVSVQVTLLNPMRVPLALTNVRVECIYSTDTSLATGNHGGAAVSTFAEPLETVQKDGLIFLNFNEFELQQLESVNFDKMEAARMAMRINPLKEGSLRIIGIHYTLNGIVHSFHKFSRHGRRLNDTKEQRMNVVYAPDNSLNMLVTSPMPLLGVTFKGVPQSLLSGEVARAELKITNEGQRGLTNLSVKVSQPAFFCFSDPDALDAQAYETESVDLLGIDAIKMSDKKERFSVENALFDASVTEINLRSTRSAVAEAESVLAPGESTTIPVWVRGDKIGKHSLRFLFVYESVERNTEMSYRTLRYNMNLTVVPSLKINAFTRPSANALHEFILGLEVENLHSATTFELIQLTSVSLAWYISPVSMDPNVDCKTQRIIRIAPKQTTYSYYRVSRAADLNDDQYPSPEEYTAQALENMLFGEGVKAAKPPRIMLEICNLPFRDCTITFGRTPLKQLSHTARLQWRVARLLETFPSIQQSSHKNIFTLYGTNDIDLTAYWRTAERNLQGHQYLIGMNLGPQQSPLHAERTLTLGKGVRALFEQTAREKKALLNTLLKNKAFKDESPLRVILFSKDVYEHDFAKEVICVVPVRISIKNVSWNRTVRYQLDMISTDAESTKSGTSSTSQHLMTSSAAHFHWTGATVCQGKLGPEETVDIAVSACFTSAGMYDINRWRLTAFNSENYGAADPVAGANPGNVIPDTAHLKHITTTPTLQHYVTVMETLTTV